MLSFFVFDLDFRSVWDPQLRARWGSPLFFEAEKINPCLLIRPVFRDARETKRTAMMKSHKTIAIFVFPCSGLTLIVF